MSEAPITLVTGASGFAGGHLAHRLVRDGARVRALVRPTSDVTALKALGVELVEGDITRREDVMRAAEGVSMIYHLAGAFRTAGHPDQYYFDVNVGGPTNVIEAARHHGVARVAHGSTIGVHGDVQDVPCTETSPFNPGDVYQVTKLEGERVAFAAFQKDVRGSVFRPCSMYGPGDLRFLKLFKSIHKGVFRMIGSGETLLHPVYVDDLIDGILLCGTKQEALGDVFVLAGPRYFTLNEFVSIIGDAVDRPVSSLRIPLFPVWAGAVVCERVCIPFGIDPPLHRRRVAFFSKNRAFSSAKAERILGYSPKVDIEEGVRKTAAWYFENGYLEARGKSAA